MQAISKLQDRQYKALIGISKKAFHELTVVFSASEQALKQQHATEYEAYYDRKPSCGGSPRFRQPSEKLFFVLYYLKSYPSFDVLGFTFGCSGKTAHENLYKFLPVLEHALERLHVLPKRKFDSVQEFIAFTKEYENLLIDATERPHHRKKQPAAQKKYYNGKKKHIQ